MGILLCKYCSGQTKVNDIPINLCCTLSFILITHHQYVSIAIAFMVSSGQINHRATRSAAATQACLIVFIADEGRCCFSVLFIFLNGHLFYILCSQPWPIRMPWISMILWIMEMILWTNKLNFEPWTHNVGEADLIWSLVGWFGHLFDILATPNTEFHYNNTVFDRESLSSPKKVLANTLPGALMDGCKDEFWLMSSLVGDCP